MTEDVMVPGNVCIRTHTPSYGVRNIFLVHSKTKIQWLTCGRDRKRQLGNLKRDVSTVEITSLSTGWTTDARVLFNIMDIPEAIKHENKT